MARTSGLWFYWGFRSLLIQLVLRQQRTTPKKDEPSLTIKHTHTLVSQPIPSLPPSFFLSHLILLKPCSFVLLIDSIRSFFTFILPTQQTWAQSMHPNRPSSLFLLFSLSFSCSLSCSQVALVAATLRQSAGKIKNKRNNQKTDFMIENRYLSQFIWLAVLHRQWQPKCHFSSLLTSKTPLPNIVFLHKTLPSLTKIIFDSSLLHLTRRNSWLFCGSSLQWSCSAICLSWSLWPATKSDGLEWAFSSWTWP
jgi:hypothetical protein